ncbi:MAG: hypothetical protein IT292_09420 [Deltaproteobacteria bacterium]|nr:hypothetical protein [Deltaproteobacteria bacterium]
MAFSHLTKSHDKLEKPLRNEVLSRDLLVQRALELAEYYSQVKLRGRAVKLQQRFKENCSILNEAYFAFSLAAKNKEVLTAGAEWLLDNYHIIDEQVREIRRDLPKNYYRALPKLVDAEWRGFPRVYRLVCNFISHTDSVVETEALTAFVDSYQSRNVLLLGELWAIPIMLRLALVENLRRLATTSLHVAEQRRQAEKLCQETIEITKSTNTDLLVNLITQLNRQPQFLETSAAYIIRKLRSLGGQANLALQWIDQQLRERGIDPAEAVRIEQQSQAQDQISFGNCITALRTVDSLDWRNWFERVSHVDAVLRDDPFKVYTQSDFITRDLNRHSIEELSRLSGFSEVDVAKKAVELAKEKAGADLDNKNDIRYQHVGYYLIDDGYELLKQALGLKSGLGDALKAWAKRHTFALYFSAIISVIAILLAAALYYSHLRHGSTLWIVLACIFMPLSLSEYAIQLVQWAVTKITRAKPLPKLDFDEGIPDEARTLVTVQTIFSHTDQIDHTIELLEVRSLANHDENIGYGILADLCDAQTEVLSGDLGVIKHAEMLINRLNERYCHNKTKRFFIMFRRRLYNPNEGKFMAWERKRGKIMELNRWLRGADHTTFNVIIGDQEFMKSARYVLTLDNDSQLPVGTAKKMIGAIAHPLNRPIFDEDKGIVVKGYSLLQPRVGITLHSGNATLFSSVFSGHSGLDPYTRTVADVYQDLFKEGSYIGKGVYDVDAFEKALHGRFGENTLLSHDLIEGVFVRCGLLSDVEVFDDFPLRYHAQAKRQQRWIRGDWQILPFIFPRIPANPDEQPLALSRKGIAHIPGQTYSYSNPLSALSRWKIIDNLRRSLANISLFFLFISLWAFAPGNPVVWLGGFLLIYSFSFYIQGLRLIFDLPLGFSFSTWIVSLINDFRKNLLLTFFNLMLVPHQGYIAANAIITTLYRIFISKKKLLEWETAYATERRLGTSLMDFVKHMLPAQRIVALTIPFSVYFYQPRFLNFMVSFYAVWLLAPVIAWAISRPIKHKTRLLEENEKTYLRQVAFETWGYFDTFLCPDYNYLIPDNLQVVPSRVVAERTSPTNISLSVLATISAYDLGFTTLYASVDRVYNVVKSLGKLERYRGHFLNWYAIRDLRPLFPRYVSSVDSGNMVGHFIAVREAASGFAIAPLISAQHIGHFIKLLRNYQNLPASTAQSWQGKFSSFGKLADYLKLFSELKKFRHDLGPVPMAAQLQKLTDELLALEPLFAWAEHLPLLKALSERQVMPSKLKSTDRILHGRTATLSLITKLTNRLLKLEQITNLSLLNEDEKIRFAELIAALKMAKEKAENMSSQLAFINSELGRLIKEADFRFLTDPQKNLLTIGFNVDTGQKDNSFYDLLASEARLASLVAIAKGDLPQTHWFKLNRALTETLGGKALLSWSGTMFEYLMPLLVMKEYPTTLLAETYRAVVKTQRLYARLRFVPWGISESAYSGVDFEKTYQYRAFGIPGLGLKRGLAEDLVVSPYSTMLALMVDAPEGVKNLKRLEVDELRGQYGFYEAVDYTPERLSADEKCHVVRSFLAHHQGMSLISINNLLNNNIFQERFHANLSIRACELLMQEKFPTRIPILVPHRAEVNALGNGDHETKAEPTQIFNTPHTLIPRTRILANRRYTLIMDNAGSSYSYVDTDMALIRWQENGMTNDSGTYIYLRDLDAGNYWSATYQPTCVEPDNYEVIFSPDKVEYKRRNFGLTSRMEVAVSPEDNLEVRRVTLVNTSNRLRNIELTSYGEVALTHRKGDLAHPAFSKMFISSEHVEDYDALIFQRRPRSDHDRKLFMFHLINMPVVWAPTQYETARQRFVGRGLSVKSPIVMENTRPLSRTVGTVLDPIFSLRNRVEIKPGESQQLAFVTGFAESHEETLQLVKKYREMQYVTRAFEMAWSHSDIELRHQQFSIGRVRDYQKLANLVLFNITKLRGAAEIVKRSRLSQSALWRFGISGDDPVVLVVLNDAEQIKFAEDLVLAHEYLRLRGFRFDLVIFNEYPGGYMQDFQQELDLLIKTGVSRDTVEKRGGIFLRSINQLSEEEIALLHSISRVVLYGNRGTLKQQLTFDQDLPPLKPRRKLAAKKQETPFKPNTDSWEYYNDFGGFTDGGKSYSLVVTKEKLPPKPWVNIIANKDFGFLVSELGSSFTWSGNSREYRLTPWSNDPTRDVSGEIIYMRDMESGNYWCPTPRPVAPTQPVVVEHGFGFSKFTTSSHDIGSVLTMTTSPTEPVKWWHLELTNQTAEEKQIEVFLYLDLVLGVNREDNYRYLATGYDSEAQMLFTSNHFNIDFSQRIAFMGSNLAIHSYTTNRFEFVGRNRSTANPVALELTASSSGLGGLVSSSKNQPVALSNTVGTGLDTCSVIKVQVELLPGSKQNVLFYLANGVSMDEARVSSPKYRQIRTYDAALEQTRKNWANTNDVIQVKTPERSFDLMLNGWLMYQTISCRLWARTGFYQCSGAIGFRDQLQDSMALLYIDPQKTKEQILLHAGRQFVEGDVQHWWHPPFGKGIRTRVSDNYLWLPYAVLEYIRITGDTDILDEQAGLLESPLLEPNQHELYNTPVVSSRRVSIYEHCMMALQRAQYLGDHRLPLIGCGDWNDGLNTVGAEGKGESVWLGWFIAHILERFSDMVVLRGDTAKAVELRRRARELVEAIDAEAWDGNWYRRAYFDDGTPMGSKLNAECQIDSLTQSWSVIAGGGDKNRQRQAMESVYTHLVNDKHRLIHLLWPPFVDNKPNPGYIQGYPAGLRENGGQYSHAAAWVVMAAALLGDGNKTLELFQMINPITHTDTHDKVIMYRTEPYVTCGDVYGAYPHVGRGGWSWYTGSSGWLYRVAVEHILGIKVSGDTFTVDPCLPSTWDRFSVKFKHRGVIYHIAVSNPDKVQRGVSSFKLDGKEIGGHMVCAQNFAAGEEHRIEVVLG